MSHPSASRSASFIEALVAGIEFIVVRGTAAVLHGAPTTTQDLDIVHRLTPENVERLAALLDRLDAYVREPGNRRLRPGPDVLGRGDRLNLSTNLGPLAPLGKLHDGRGYDELLPTSVVMQDGELKLRVIDLDTLIAIKAATGRNRDKLFVPILMALRDGDDPL